MKCHIYNRSSQQNASILPFLWDKFSWTCPFHIAYLGTLSGLLLKLSWYSICMPRNLPGIVILFILTIQMTKDEFYNINNMSIHFHLFQCCTSIIYLYLADLVLPNKYILTSNENATPKYTSISKGYIEYTFTEDFWWFREYNTHACYWLK